MSEEVVMTAIEALELALRKEKAAIKLYKELSIKHKAISGLFTSLASEELRHQRMIEKAIQKLTRY
jgi:rubrerythrin